MKTQKELSIVKKKLNFEDALHYQKLKSETTKFKSTILFSNETQQFLKEFTFNQSDDKKQLQNSLQKGYNS